jgi:hypothetical protein
MARRRGERRARTSFSLPFSCLGRNDGRRERKKRGAGRARTNERGAETRTAVRRRKRSGMGLRWKMGQGRSAGVRGGVLDGRAEPRRVRRCTTNGGREVEGRKGEERKRGSDSASLHGLHAALFVVRGSSPSFTVTVSCLRRLSKRPVWPE